MPLHSASYFAGVGTVVGTMAIGFGGGVLLTDAFVGKSERTPTRMERRAAPLAEATPVVASAPTPPTDSQRVAPVSPPQPLEQQPPPQAAAPQQAAAPPQATPAQQQAAAPQTVTPQQPPVQPAQTSAQAPATQEQTRFENSMGQVREVDLRRREAEARRAATAERRKQERRKWAERRKREMEQVDELTAVTEKVKQIERPRERDTAQRSFAAESRPRAPPVFGLFGRDDDDD
jgi:hypothetical protein